MNGWTPLATERVTAILDELQNVDDMNGGRLFDTWVPTVPASDGEIMLHVSSQVIAADIIQLDQAAVIHAAPPLRTTRVSLPKLKHGHMLSEEMIDLLDRIGQNLSTASDRSVFDNYVAGRLQWLLDGVRDRRELLLSAMLCDDGDYNRFGIIFSNLTWGLPASLKTTVATAWSDTAAATPIANIETQMQTAEDDYGEMYDTIVLTRQGMNEMTATDEFQTRGTAWVQMRLTSGQLPAGNIFSTRGNTQQLAENLLSDSLRRQIKFVVYNKRTKLEAGTGALSNAQFLPDDKVLLLDSGDIGNSRAWDFGNAMVTESKPGMVPNIIGGFQGGGAFGPVAYATGADPNGNPPGQVLWAVQRGFPRRIRESANAVLTI